MMRKVVLGDVVKINPATKVTKGQLVKFISMDKLDPFTKTPNGYEKKKFSSGTKFTNGDTLLARITPCLENGKTAFVDFLDDLEVAAGSTEFVILRNIEGLTDPAYIYYLSISPAFRDYAIKSMVGTSGRQRVQNDVLAKMELSLPPLDQQKKIANILGSLDEKIELNRRMNETLEQLGQALFRYYFVDNPEAKNWKRGVISDLGEVVTGKTPSKKNQKFFGDEVAFLKVPDMHKTSIVIKTSDNLSLMGAESQKSKYISRWSTCVSCIATVGVVSLAGKNMQTNQQINSIIPRESYFKFFNYFLMRHKSDYIKTLASSGSATPNLNMGHFSNITVVIPDRELLKEFDARVNHLFLQMENNLQENETLMNIRDSLLLKLISGEIIL